MSAVILGLEEPTCTSQVVLNLSSLLIWSIPEKCPYRTQYSMYFLFAEEFILEDPKDYHFLSNKLLPVPGVDDAAEFQSTVNAMNIMGMTNEDYSGKWTLLLRSIVRPSPRH